MGLLPVTIDTGSGGPVTGQARAPTGQRNLLLHVASGSHPVAIPKKSHFATAVSAKAEKSVRAWNARRMAMITGREIREEYRYTG